MYSQPREPAKHRSVKGNHARRKVFEPTEFRVTMPPSMRSIKEAQ